MMLGGAMVGYVMQQPPLVENLGSEHEPGEEPPDIDLGYAQAMLVHHQQALMMASYMVSPAVSQPDPNVVQLARRIVQVQSAEVEQLKGWLLGREAPVLPLNGDLMAWMKSADAELNVDEKLFLERCKQSPLGMAGLRMPEELQQLGDANLPMTDRQRRFLTWMIAHHEAAMAMSTLPSRRALTPYIRQLANEVLVQQAREVLIMKALLKRLS
nr:DUF305 domain-containing protein [Limnobacter humi]